MQKMTDNEKTISVLLSHIRYYEPELEYHKQQVEKLQKLIDQNKAEIVKLID